MEGKENMVSTTVMDSFFDDPFFKGWWKDFEAPQEKSYKDNSSSELSERPRSSLLDSFFDLKAGSREGFPPSSSTHSSSMTSSSSSSMSSSSSGSSSNALSLQDGLYSLEVDIQDFDPEDIDITIQKGQLVLHGEKEIQRGNSFLKRQFNQRFGLPESMDTNQITSKLKSNGKLVISAPQVSRALKIDERGGNNVLAQREEFLSSDKGSGVTDSKDKKRRSDSQIDKRQKIRGVGSIEQETSIEIEESLFESSSSSSSKVTSSGHDEHSSLGLQSNQRMQVGDERKTIRTTKTQESLRQEGGKVVQSTSKSSREEGKETFIPISYGSVSPSVRTPKPRFHPFEFPTSANDMMAAMQKNMKEQMAALQKATLSSVKQSSCGDEDISHQEFFVPLKNINQVTKTALANASAMAKMKGDMFELVVNIKRFAPEDVKVYVMGQSVLVKAERKLPEGDTMDSYEQKFTLPSDVNVNKLTSGISTDGILMIRVPRLTPERVIPILYDSKISAIQKALQETVSHVETSMTSEEVQNELKSQNIVPQKIEKHDDVVKAASAEVIESLTIGVAEQAGSESGEESGAKFAAKIAQETLANDIKKAVEEVCTTVGNDVAGDWGVKIALQEACKVGQEAGAKAASEQGIESGREVGRITGCQAASIAAAEELAKMNVADLTIDKVKALTPTFLALGAKIGTESGERVGRETGKTIDSTVPLALAKEAAAKAAETAAMKVKVLLDIAQEEANNSGEFTGREEGKKEGEKAGEEAAVKQAVTAAREAASKAAQVILGDQGEELGNKIGSTLGKDLARKLGWEMGGALGAEAGQKAGREAAYNVNLKHVKSLNPLNMTPDKYAALRKELTGLAEGVVKEASGKAGREAGQRVNIELIVNEVVAVCCKAAEEQALEIQSFQSMGAEDAAEAGKLSGESAGRLSGAEAGEKIALQIVVPQAVEEAVKIGKKILGDRGIKIAKEIGEAVARDVAIKMGHEMGSIAGSEAGSLSGSQAGFSAAQPIYLQHNILVMNPEELSILKNQVIEVGSKAGAEAGHVAGCKAGSEIDLACITKEAIEAAVRATTQAAQIAKASEDAAEVVALENMLLSGAKEAGENAGEDSVKQLETIDSDFIAKIVEVAEMAGRNKGLEIFGDFGGSIGSTAAKAAATKAAISKTKELLLAEAGTLSKQAGGEAALKMAQQEIAKHDLKGDISTLSSMINDIGSKAGHCAGVEIIKEAYKKINIEELQKYVSEAAIKNAEKYATKAKEFYKMATKIGGDAGAKTGEETGKKIGAEVGEKIGGETGERVGREAGKKAALEISGDLGVEAGGEAGAKAGYKFGTAVGLKAGKSAGGEAGRKAGNIAGQEAAGAEALASFEIGISKERVLALRKLFHQLGSKAGSAVGTEIGAVEGGKAAEEEASKFAYEEGAKAGAAVARKLKATECKKLKAEGMEIGEDVGCKAGEAAGALAGEEAGALEAEKLGAEEGERIGREIAGEEGAEIGRQIGAEIAKIAGGKLGKKVGKIAGANAGRKAGSAAGESAGEQAALEISREKVDALRKLFAEIAANAGSTAGAEAARSEALKAVRLIAVETAAKAAREKILALASQGKIELSGTWKPTALIAVIACRTDLSDMEKIKLAAKAKMEGNLGDLLPKKFHNKWEIPEDPLEGKLKFQADDKSVLNAQEQVDPNKKWQTVVFSDLPDPKKPRERSSAKDNVNSLRAKFETCNMKDNEAYVIM